MGGGCNDDYRDRSTSSIESMSYILVGFLPLQLGSRFSARASINFFAGGETVTFSRSTTVSLAGQPFLTGTTEL